MSGQTLVGVVMGSDSDWETMQPAAAALSEFGIAHEVHVVSAHDALPGRLAELQGGSETTCEALGPVQSALAVYVFIVYDDGEGPHVATWLDAVPVGVQKNGTAATCDRPTALLHASSLKNDVVR